MQSEAPRKSKFLIRRVDRKQAHARACLADMIANKRMLAHVLLTTLLIKIKIKKQ